MIKNAVSSLMVRFLHLPRAAPTLTYRPLLPLPPPRLRVAASASAPLAAMSTAAQQAVADQKRAVRSDVRRALKALSLDQRTSEDLAIQNNILNSSWFKASKRLCAYISCAQLREVDTSKIIAEVLSLDPGESTGPYIQICSVLFPLSDDFLGSKNMMDKQRISMFLEWKIKTAICACSKSRPWMI
uniref:5-formyltetrahydrofolate cyclo-ligase n=1 Tax=Aegilops tauschii subsp. strangulata TaxID=200361 RepID=A0A453B7V3_AEGTS